MLIFLRMLSSHSNIMSILYEYFENNYNIALTPKNRGNDMNLFHFFGQLEDPRKDINQKYPFLKLFF